MRIHADDPVWLNEAALCSFDDLVELSGLAPAELAMLVESGVLQPAQPQGEQAAGGNVFYASCIVQVRSARRLRDDFELDAAGLAVAVNLLGRIQELERQLQALTARQP
ncbi:MAG TPA: chaperone modulator CbpM [Burkholderiaceae bacterium]|nr:chaperone modulator CbpM [Burkholderiaceae bacterium]